MPDLFDLDQTFADLAHDVGARTRPPGAADAQDAGRRRRRTRIATIGACLAVVVGGGAVLTHQGLSHRGAGPAATLPEPRALSAQVLDDVTRGWVSGWAEPVEFSGPGVEPSAAQEACASALLALSPDDVAAGGGTVFTSGRSVAVALGTRMGSATAAEVVSAAEASQSCGHVRTRTLGPEASLVTARVEDDHGSSVFAVVGWRDRIALLGVSSPQGPTTEDIQTDLGRAALAAIQVGATVTEYSPVMRAAFDPAGGLMMHQDPRPGSSEPAPDVSMQLSSPGQLWSALWSWAGSSRRDDDLRSHPSAGPDGVAPERKGDAGLTTKPRGKARHGR